jgi:hypothetical protein
MFCMALELNQLLNQVNQLSTHAAERLDDLNQRLPLARAALHSLTTVDDELQAKVHQALRLRWGGAVPTQEGINRAFPAPACPARLNILGADGSQIYPDRHSLALYYLINVGSIVFKHGSGEAPQVFSRPEVFYEDADLYEEDSGAQIPVEKINAERDTRELGELARLAEQDNTVPTVALLDNGLLLYITLQTTNQKLSDAVLRGYLKQLDVLKTSGAAVAGVVDRPRAASVVRLLHLAMLKPDEIREENLRDLGPFNHLTDGRLFEFLQPGERSALFENGSPANQDRYKPAGHSIYFFYLNAGRAGREALLRVEVPEWVAKDEARLNLVHAALLEQCRITDGFPYVLVRAHELAVVTQSERREFDNMVLSAMVRRGLIPSVSHKAQGKAWTGTGKRRYP